MAVPSEVRRVETAIANRNMKELEWSLWYCRMRQRVPSARPADLKYWRAVEEKVQETLTPAVSAPVYASKRKKKGVRGLGLSPLGPEAEPEDGLATGAETEAEDGQPGERAGSGSGRVK